MKDEEYRGIYKKHAIEIRRDSGYNNWFYIMVYAPDGTLAYDGWWEDSQDATIDQAIAEAKDGALL